jgi:dTDP-4-dehydrorhamnose 3,5-epimerase
VKVDATALPGVLRITPTVFRDDRGFFLEWFNARAFAAAGLPTAFVQDNHSRSAAGVVRGLHYQLVQPQGKLVRVTRGAIMGAAVDIRVGSPTFGRSTTFDLSDQNLGMVWIPPGFAHGFCALTDGADVVYKCTDFYAPDDDHGIFWNDPDLAIAWPAAAARVSAKDARYLPLRAPRSDLPVYQP